MPTLFQKFNPYNDYLDSIRFLAIAGYCFFQIIYSLLLLGYGLLVPSAYNTLIPTALISIPIYILAIILARENYALTTKVLVILAFTVQSIFTLTRTHHPGILIIAVTVYLCLALLLLATVGWKWAIGLLILSGICLAIAIPLTDFSFDEASNKPDFRILLFHLACYATFIFVFAGFLIYFFEKYMRLYFSQLGTSMKLNFQLEEQILKLNDLNTNLEEHTAAITDANNKLTEYARVHSHEVRGQVASILGLLNISRMDRTVDKEFIFESLLGAASELDRVLLKMSDLLNDVNIQDYKSGHR